MSAPKEDDDFDQLVDIGAYHHYQDAILYDYEYRRRRKDIRFYTDLATRKNPDRDSPILELACGSGRVSAGLLRAGHRVLGIDRSAPMLERAQARFQKMGRAHRARVHLVRADMRKFRVGQKVSLVISAFNSFEHLYTRADFEACLRSIHSALSNDGVLAFDVQNPDLEWLIRNPTKRWAKTTFLHPVTRTKIIYTTNHFYDPVSQICLIRIYYKPQGDDKTEQIINLSQRKFFPAELEGLLWANNFRVISRFGDFDGEPLSGDAESQVILAQPR